VKWKAVNVTWRKDRDATPSAVLRHLKHTRDLTAEGRALSSLTEKSRTRCNGWRMLLDKPASNTWNIFLAVMINTGRFPRRSQALPLENTWRYRGLSFSFCETHYGWLQSSPLAWRSMNLRSLQLHPVGPRHFGSKPATHLRARCDESSLPLLERGQRNQPPAGQPQLSLATSAFDHFGVSLLQQQPEASNSRGLETWNFKSSGIPSVFAYLASLLLR